MRTNLVGIVVALGLSAAVYAAQAPQGSAPQGGAPNVQINITGGGRAGRGARGAGRGALPGRGLPGRALSFPQFTRSLASPEVIAAGQQVYSTSCASCHGADLRGSAQGVNLLEAEVDLLDQHGEMITPILRGQSTPLGTHPSVSETNQQITDVAEYIHAEQAKMSNQGRPPANPKDVPTDLELLVGNPNAGKAYFDAHCASCHQGDPGNLAGIGSKYPDIRTLQNTWVEGSVASGGGRFGRGGPARTGTVTVTLNNGRVVTGSLLQEDEFNVTLREANGNRVTFDRGYDVKSVVVKNPGDAHKEMARGLNSISMHDITAYLHTLTQ